MDSAQQEKAPPRAVHTLEPQYPPQDRGLKAWLFLLGASIVEITAWGTFSRSASLNLCC